MAKTLKNEDLRLNLIVHGDSAKKVFFEAATAAAKIKEELNLAEQALAAKPVIVDVKLQNLKANHNFVSSSTCMYVPVIVDVKLQNLKANHNRAAFAGIL